MANIYKLVPVKYYAPDWLISSVQGVKSANQSTVFWQKIALCPFQNTMTLDRTQNIYYAFAYYILTSVHTVKRWPTICFEKKSRNVAICNIKFL